ncbi:MAG: hypothetical protein H6809_03705 [Phycisphaeraceae bacterium]|nr:hypothetical protein [Phycisphaeraceae bacterium]
MAKKKAKPAPASRTFDKPLQVRVTESLYESFVRAAKADGRSLSNWARDRLEKAAAEELEHGTSSNR